MHDSDEQITDLETRMREGFKTSDVPVFGPDAEAIVSQGRSARTRRAVLGAALGLSVAGVGGAVWSQMGRSTTPVEPAGTSAPTSSTQASSSPKPTPTPTPTTPTPTPVPKNPPYLGRKLPPIKKRTPSGPEDGPSIMTYDFTLSSQYHGPAMTYQVGRSQGRKYPTVGDTVTLRFGNSGHPPVTAKIPKDGEHVVFATPKEAYQVVLYGGSVTALGSWAAEDEYGVYWIEDSTGNYVGTIVHYLPGVDRSKATIYQWQGVGEYCVWAIREKSRDRLVTTAVDFGVDEPSLVAEDPVNKTVIVTVADGMFGGDPKMGRWGKVEASSKAVGGRYFATYDAETVAGNCLVLLPEGAEIDLAKDPSVKVSKKYPYAIAGERVVMHLFTQKGPSGELPWKDAQGGSHVASL